MGRRGPDAPSGKSGRRNAFGWQMVGPLVALSREEQRAVVRDVNGLIPPAASGQPDLILDYARWADRRGWITGSISTAAVVAGVLVAIVVSPVWLPLSGGFVGSAAVSWWRFRAARRYLRQFGLDPRVGP